MSTELGTAFRVSGVAWIAGPGEDGEAPDTYWADGVVCTVEAERTDDNEIRVGMKLGTQSSDASTDDATFYLTDAEAARLAQMLGALVLG